MLGERCTGTLWTVFMTSPKSKIISKQRLHWKRGKSKSCFGSFEIKKEQTATLRRLRDAFELKLKSLGRPSRLFLTWFWCLFPDHLGFGTHNQSEPSVDALENPGGERTANSWVPWGQRTGWAGLGWVRGWVAPITRHTRSSLSIQVLHNLTLLYWKKSRGSCRLFLHVIYNDKYCILKRKKAIYNFKK